MELDENTYLQILFWQWHQGNNPVVGFLVKEGNKLGMEELGLKAETNTWIYNS